ncbi:MAG: septum formation initiator family protein [Clostridiales bacterium]|nr:septum formation initiator family protein [Clostridiales bacterium]
MQKAASPRNAEVRRTVYNRQQHTQAFATGTPFASGAYASAYARAASIRARAAAVQSRPHASAKKAVRSKGGLRQLIRGGRADEVRVKSSPIPKGLVIAIVLFTAIVMMIVFSFAQINEFKREISDLEAERTELNGEIDQLAIELDLKNDVRVIEQTAREDIGMVRRNQVESKYINIAQGDRVEVIDDTEENAEDFGIFTTLLSSVGSGWDKLLEYID